MRRSVRWLIALFVLTLLGAVLTPTIANASTPASGTLSLSGSHQANWQSPVYAKGTGGGASSCPANDPDNATCDHFDLTVDTPASYWDDTPEGGVPVSIQWPNKSDDFDLYVYDSSGKEVAESAGTADPEVALIPKASGTYHVLVVPYDVKNASYAGSAYLATNTDAGDVTKFAAGSDGTYAIEAGLAKAKVYFTADDQLRLQFAPDGEFTDPAGTEIVRDPPKPIASRWADHGDYYAISA
ncbi:MAG: hypothetical protein J2O49_03015, partial [Sciscionella sp.]|nr:hypothetical protein [Sciscionella sp.]